MTNNISDIGGLAERVAELETRLTFQDQTVEELNQVLYSQQNEIDMLRQELSILQRKLAEVLAGGREGKLG